MGFVQIFECRTKDVDGLLELDREWRSATEGKRTLRRSTIARDRSDPGRYFVIAEFDSYESAMQNSELPETQRFAERQSEFLEGPPVFHDLDVVEEMA